MAEIDDGELEQLRAAASKAADLEGDAAIGRAHRETESKRITEAASRLSSEDRELVEGEPDLARRAALVARLSAAGSGRARANPGGGPPMPKPYVGDFDTAWRNGEFREARERDPKGAAEWLASKAQIKPKAQPFSWLGVGSAQKGRP
jgi:hypothetical protein